MAFEEKNAWIMGGVTIVAYLAYLFTLLGRADGVPLAEVPYIGAMLWSIGGAIIATIALVIVVAIMAPDEADKRDQRDREIHRFGEYVGQSFQVIGGLGALVLAMLEAPHFWIANAIYLCFALAGLLSCVAKIVAYRRGFHPW